MTNSKYKSWVIVIVLSLVGLFLIFTIIKKNFSIPFYTYEGFGVQIPNGYNVLGIDVSHYQEKINWKQVSSMEDMGMHVRFAIIKATQGNYLTDRMYERNWAEAKKHDLHRGAYLFFDARRDGAAQANYFIKKVDLTEGDFPPIIDFEELYGVPAATARQRFLVCATILENKYGVKPILYTYSNFYKKKLNEDFEQFPLWIAHYKNYGEPEVDRDWKIWQFSDSGK